MNRTAFTYTFTAYFPSPSGRGRDHVKRGVVSAYDSGHALRLVTEHLRLTATEVDRAAAKGKQVRLEVHALPDFAPVTIVG